MAKYSAKASKFIGNRMKAAAKGKMHSGSAKGPVVKSKKQALAIALSEARSKGMKAGKAPKPGLAAMKSEKGNPY